MNSIKMHLTDESRDSTGRFDFQLDLDSRDKAITEDVSVKKAITTAKRATSASKLVFFDEAETIVWLHKKGYSHCLQYRLPRVIKREVKKLIQDGRDVPGCYLASKDSDDEKRK